MPSYDYNALPYHVTTRDQVNASLLEGMFPADRAAWSKDPHFMAWPSHLQRLHASITEANARLINGLEAILDEPEGSIQEVMGLTGMTRLGTDLVDHVHGHHRFEDANVLPGFLGRFPQLSQAIDLLEKDHVFLDQALEQSEPIFAKLNGNGTSKTTIDKALKQAKVLNTILYRHTYDEEDILIPAVLHAYG